MSASSRKLILWLLITIFLSALAYALFSIFSFTRETKDLIAQTDAISGSDGWTRSVENLIASSAEDLTVLEEVALDRSQILSLVEFIEEVGSDLDLSIDISSLSDESGASSAGPQFVRMVVETDGGWSQSLSFIKALQALPYKTRIDLSDLSRLESDVWHTSNTLRVLIFP